MANYENIKDKGFDKRSTNELREIQSRGGKASGKSRRRKAALRDTMNRLLTMQVDVTGLSEVLLADGGESTYEEVIGMAMIEQAMAGNVKAYQAIMQTVGQTVKSDSDLENQQADTELKRAKKQAVTGENETDVDMELNINIDYGDKE